MLRKPDAKAVLTTPASEAGDVMKDVVKQKKEKIEELKNGTGPEVAAAEKAANYTAKEALKGKGPAIEAPKVEAGNKGPGLGR